jgi:hypothetical protein
VKAFLVTQFSQLFATIQYLGLWSKAHSFAPFSTAGSAPVVEVFIDAVHDYCVDLGLESSSLLMCVINVKSNFECLLGGSSGIRATRASCFIDVPEIIARRKRGWRLVTNTTRECFTRVKTQHTHNANVAAERLCWTQLHNLLETHSNKYPTLLLILTLCLHLFIRAYMPPPSSLAASNSDVLSFLSTRDVSDHLVGLPNVASQLAHP